jgi:hypothetical protein
MSCSAISSANQRVCEAIHGAQHLELEFAAQNCSRALGVRRRRQLATRSSMHALRNLI